MSNKDKEAVRIERDQQSGLVPKLRFPAFRNAVPWEEKKLSDLLFEPKHRNRNLKYGPNDVLSVSGEYGCVNQIEFMGRSYAGVSVKDYHVVETGDIVYTKSPLKVCPFGIIKENKGRSGIVSTLYAVYRPTKMLLSTYLDHFFSRHYNLNSYLQPIVKKGAKNDMKVNNSDVLTGSIWVPKIDEQQKIADCLSSIDALIAVETGKLNVLKDHKKGLMHRLFPAKGETSPLLRLQTFQDDQEWEQKTLGEICDVLQGYGFPELMQGKKQGDYPFCKVSDISRAVIENGAILNTSANYLDEFELHEIRAKPIPIGSTVFAKIGEALRLNRRAILEVECLIDNNAVGLKAKNGVAVDYFVYLLSQTIDMSEHCGGALPAVNKSTLEGISISIPKPSEQERIVSCFLSLDEAIAAEAKKIENIKTYKRGLMQQLFPVPDEALE
jgi:type I restriction enzyme, S subunit